MDTYNKILVLILIFTCQFLVSEGRRLQYNANYLRSTYNSSNTFKNAKMYESMQKRNYSEEPATEKDSNTQLIVSSRAVKNDPWQGYYDFLINEGSYKFWAVFQVATALVLIYSAAAAIYYAKYNFIQPDYEYDYFFGRSDDDVPYSSQILSEGNLQIFQRILDAISSNKYS